MNHSSSTTMDAEDEIAILVRRLHETQERLQEVAGGEVDAVVLPGGNSFLLHEAQERLRLSEENFRRISERLELATTASRIGIWDWDIAQGNMHWDDQMFALYGASPEDPKVGIELWQRHIHPDDHERANAELAEAMQPGGRSLDLSFRIVTARDGEVRHLHAVGRVFRDEADLPIRMLGTNWDVTDQVRREEILQQKLENERNLVRQALAGEKAKSEFLAVMSHEIRTPMNGVLGFAELLSHSPTLTPEDLDLSQTIVASGEALLRIIDDILDFSRIEAGHLAIEKQLLEPGEIVDGIRALFTRQIREKGLQFLVTVADSAQRAFLGDAGRIRQILINLVGNAVKFTESGSIRLDVLATVDGNRGGILEFNVRDTGVGVSPDRAEAIFESFTQSDSSISRRHGGTGLGLTISRRLAELMGGDLRMTSPPGGGTLFTLQIPFSLCETPATPEPRSTPAPPMDAEFARHHPQRILVVEDDHVNLKLLVSVLRKFGYEPFTARNGLEAVEAYMRESPDCVLMDMQMPEMDGVEATQRIRTLEEAGTLRPAFISALTANILPEAQQRCLEAGMNVYLNKPIKRQAVANMLIMAWEFHETPTGT